ncbi:MAG: hypothetical protein ACYCT1_08085 [Steroidobacteraceae bacterium]
MILPTGVIARAMQADAGGGQPAGAEAAAFIAGMLVGGEAVANNEPFDWWAFFLGASVSAAAIVMGQALAASSPRRWERR